MLLQKREDWKRSKDCRDGLHHLQNLLRKRCLTAGRVPSISDLINLPCTCVSQFTGSCLPRPCRGGSPTPTQPMSALFADLLSQCVEAANPRAVVVQCISTLSSLTLSVCPLPKILLSLLLLPPA